MADAIDEETATYEQVADAPADPPTQPNQYYVDLDVLPSGADLNVSDTKVGQQAHAQSMARDATARLLIGRQDDVNGRERWSAALVQPRFARMGGVVLTLDAPSAKVALERAVMLLQQMADATRLADSGAWTLPPKSKS